MGNSGLGEVLKAAFGGVTRMLPGKNFPQNTRALRMVAEELLQPIISRAESHEESSMGKSKFQPDWLTISPLHGESKQPVLYLQ